MRLTFLRRQASQALLTAGGINEEDSGMADRESHINLGKETSRGPYDRSDKQNLSHAGLCCRVLYAVRRINAALEKVRHAVVLGSVMVAAYTTD